MKVKCQEGRDFRECKECFEKNRPNGTMKEFNYYIMECNAYSR